MGRIVNQRELSEITGISAKSLSLWVREGLPVTLETENGLSNQYDTEAVINWYVAREVSKGAKETEKDRLSRLQGDKIEMELAEKRRELIPASEIGPAVTSMIVAFRQAALSVAPRIAPLLSQMGGDVDALRALVQEAMEECLQKLATDGERSAEALEDAVVRGGDAATANAGIGVGGEIP